MSSSNSASDPARWKHARAVNPLGPRDGHLSRCCVVCPWSSTPHCELQGKLKWVTSHRLRDQGLVPRGGVGLVGWRVDKLWEQSEAPFLPIQVRSQH